MMGIVSSIQIHYLIFFSVSNCIDIFFQNHSTKRVFTITIFISLNIIYTVCAVDKILFHYIVLFFLYIQYQQSNRRFIRSRSLFCCNNIIIIISASSPWWFQKWTTIELTNHSAEGIYLVESRDLFSRKGIYLVEGVL